MIDGLGPIRAIRSAQDFYSHTHAIKSPKFFLIDVDHTLIWPTSLTLRTREHHNMIHVLKENIRDEKSYQKIIGQWRIQRKVSLTDTQWPFFLEKIKEKNPVYGLTKIETGRFGPIESMEQWRMNELEKMGLFFSNNPKIEHLCTAKGPSLYKGCIVTGNTTKATAFNTFFPDLRHPLGTSKEVTIIMLDDKKEQLESMGTYCSKKKIPFFGFRWRYPLTHSCPELDALAHRQKEYLLKPPHHHWIES